METCELVMTSSQRATLEAIEAIRAAGGAPTSAALAAVMGTSRSAALFRVARLRKLGLFDGRLGTPRGHSAREALAAADRVLARGDPLTVAALVAELGCSESWARARVRQLRGLGRWPHRVLRPTEVLAGAVLAAVARLDAAGRPLTGPNLGAELGLATDVARHRLGRLRRRGLTDRRIVAPGPSADRAPGADRPRVERAYSPPDPAVMAEIRAERLGPPRPEPRPRPPRRPMTPARACRKYIREWKARKLADGATRIDRP